MQWDIILDRIPDIIEQAAKSPLGIVALSLVIVGLLAVAFFSKGKLWFRMGGFLVVVGFCAFACAMVLRLEPPPKPEHLFKAIRVKGKVIFELSAAEEQPKEFLRTVGVLLRDSNNNQATTLKPDETTYEIMARSTRIGSTSGGRPPGTPYTDRCAIEFDRVYRSAQGPYVDRACLSEVKDIFFSAIGILNSRHNPRPDLTGNVILNCKGSGSVGIWGIYDNGNEVEIFETSGSSIWENATDENPSGRAALSRDLKLRFTGLMNQPGYRRLLNP